MKNKKTVIDKSTKFSELMQKHPEAIEILLDKGMHCIGCHLAIHETLEQGALMHGLDPEQLVREINNKINQSESLKKIKPKNKKKKQ